MIKGIYRIKLRGKIWTTVLSSEIRQGCPLLPLPFNFVFEDLSNIIREKSEMKGMKSGRKEVNPYLLADNMILYIEKKISILQTIRIH